jgi:hypothetical protein
MCITCQLASCLLLATTDRDLTHIPVPTCPIVCPSDRFLGETKPKDSKAPMDPINRRIQVVNMDTKTASKRRLQRLPPAGEMLFAPPGKLPFISLATIAFRFLQIGRATHHKMFCCMRHRRTAFDFQIMAISMRF